MRAQTDSTELTISFTSYDAEGNIIDRAGLSKEVTGTPAPMFFFNQMAALLRSLGVVVDMQPAEPPANTSAPSETDFDDLMEQCRPLSASELGLSQHIAGRSIF